MDKTGSCLCGAVKYKATGLKAEMGSCHCSMCRKWSGGPALSVQPEALEIEGKDAITTYSSSKWAERAFCKHCGSNLFYKVKNPEIHVLWAGSLDDLDGLSLGSEIYIDHKPEGYAFAGDHPRLTEKEFLKSIGVPVEE